MNKKNFPDLHVHSMDQFDSHNDPESVCAKYKELGAEGFALTQHGVLSGIEPMREKATEYGLKFIPGIETYYGNDDDLRQNKHLILLSADHQGYKAIWKAVSDRQSQNSTGRAVMNDSILEKYFAEGSDGHDHVIATSACVNGVIAAIVRSNETVERDIEKIRKKAVKVESSSERLEQVALVLAEIDSNIAEKTTRRNEVKQIAETKFARREMMVEKLLKNEDPAYEAAAELLAEDKKRSEKAKEELETVKKELTALKRRRSINAAEFKDLQIAAEKEAQFGNQINALESRMMTKDEIYEAAKKEALKMQKIFGKNNFYIEIQNHGIDIEAHVYPILVKLARELNLPLVATNDVHIVDNTEEELLRRRILRALRFEKWEEDQAGDDQLYIKTDDEMIKSLSEIFPKDVVEEALNNTKVIFDRCDVQFPEEKHYPVYPSVDGKNADEMLLDAIRAGAKWRFPDGLDDAHKNRINYEYQIIKSMGYADYHLIVKDFLEYARILAVVPTHKIANAPLDIEKLKKWVDENGWTGGYGVGTGRGSAVGSLVCFCLGITNLDPLSYDLLFERFLNPERVSMPDIDSDISNRTRSKVIEYVRAKYGEDAVCGIMTTNAQAPRGAIRIAAKYYGLSLGKEKEFLTLGDQMAKQVSNESGTGFNSEMGMGTVSEYLQNVYEDNIDALNILKWAMCIEGCFTSYGAHAAGIVISDGAPVSEYVPLRWNNKLSEMTTQVDMNRVESKGLIKMDFLGLRTLDIITDCIRMIKEKTGKVIDPLKDISMDDEKVYTEIFQKGRTNAVFQFASSGMKSMLQRFKPNSFEDLIILVSMFRPGPLQYLDDVIDVKRGAWPMEFLTPELEPILSKTYGAITYQEQVMEIFQKLAGYTLGGADMVRRYMSKKKAEKLAHERRAFINGDEARNIKGCVANGIDADVANELFDQMTNFAKYAFNKSHAAAYSANSYYTAWFKYHYPAEFLAAALNWAQDNKEMAGLIREAKFFGIEVLGPDINRSYEKFTVENGKIRFGLSPIKNVGSGANEIVEVRKNGPYTSLCNFFERTNVNKRAVINLMTAGAFDLFSANRTSMVSVVEMYKKLTSDLDSKRAEVEEMKENTILLEGTNAAKLQKKIDTAKNTIRKLEMDINNIVLPDIEEDLSDRINAEKEMLGSYISAHPLDEYENPSEYNAVYIKDVATQAAAQRKKTSIVGVINSVVIRKTKIGNEIAILEVEDTTGIIKTCVFSKVYPKYKDMLKTGLVFKFSGDVLEDTYGDEEDKTYTFRVLSIGEIKKQREMLQIMVANKEKYMGSLSKLKKYQDDNGYKLCILLNDTDTEIIAPFRVSEGFKQLKNVKIVKTDRKPLLQKLL